MKGRTKSAGGYGTIPADWGIAPLPEVVFFQEGPGLRKWQWTDSGMKVINVTNILGDGQIDTSNTDRHISMVEFSKTYSHFAVNDGDIVIASSGNTYGKIGRISAKDLPLMMNTSVIRFRSSDKQRLDDDFLYAFLRTGVFRNQIESFVIGSAQPNFGPSHLKQMVIILPPLSVQRRIAGMLSAYDDLVENSHRRIKILEAMARALYREWFVSFRFPGHEKHPRVASPLGDIPKGWEYRPLSELGFVGRGKSRHRPRNEPSLYGGPYPFFQTGDIKNARVFLRTHTQTYSETGLAQSKLWHAGTLCITIAANIAETAILAKAGCFPDSVVGFVPDLEKSDAFYVKMYLDSIKQQMQNVSRGTTQDNLSLEKLLSFQVLAPPSSIIHAFREKTLPMLESLNLLLQQEENLRQTRDLLLPRLLSGQSSIG